jgi:hypothetical protein
VSAAADGKVVWAELAANGDHHPAATPHAPDLRHAPPAAAPRSPDSRTVGFVGVPVDGYLDLQAHNDALFRELELISIELEGDDSAEVAAPWPTSSTSSTGASGAGGARSYLALLEQADELCRSGLLTPSPRPTSAACAAGSSRRRPPSSWTAPPRLRPRRLALWPPTR